jgi:hypothetical protein
MLGALMIIRELWAIALDRHSCKSGIFDSRMAVQTMGFLTQRVNVHGFPPSRE